MQFLLTNDDGIAAPGLAALERAAAGLGQGLVLAPASPLSGCSHQVTTDRALRISSTGPGRHCVDGTPADCVRLGLHLLAADTAVVLSGINAGGNLGADVHHSGTVAAVREAVLHGKPGIAVSHYKRKGREIDWEWAAAIVRPILEDLLARPWLPGSFWNINLPHPVPGEPDPRVIFCPLDDQPLPISFRAEGDVWHYDGNYHQRRRKTGTDVDVCFRGDIAVTRIHLFDDRGHEAEG